MTFPFSNTSGDSLPSSISSQEEDFGRYSPGNTLILKRHTPPPPCGPFYEGTARSRILPERVSKLEWCLTHPPRPGVTDLQDTRTIIIKAQIRTGHQCGAQVLLTNDDLVAKIYDPHCYCIFDREWPSDTINVTAHADQDYSREAAAYSALQDSSIQNRCAPGYYGSWTTDVSIEVEGQEHIREVRLILMEHIKGIQLMKINPEDLTRQARDNLMRKVIEADTDLRIAGLKHKDFEPRNIMIAAPGRPTAGEESPYDIPFEDPEIRVCVIDFAMSCVLDIAGQERVGARFRNPLFFWAGADIYSEYGWLPQWEEATNWMWEIWGCGGEHGKYIKVERDMDDYLGRPFWPEG
ncbi:hypothetical protein SVAN01_02977 [Stagonosporopsis vannaccii]|nr:hypothetical protein SVAN01_02977 [Stagonosporopsis vannaccii]